MNEFNELANMDAIASIAYAYCRDSRSDSTNHLRDTKAAIINDSDVTHDVMVSCLKAIDMLCAYLEG